MRVDVPQFHLLLDAAAHRVAGDDAAQHAGRFGQVVPVALGELVDGLQEDRAMAQQRGAGVRRGIQRPFQTGVADVDGQEGHGMDDGVEEVPGGMRRERSSATPPGRD